MAEPTSQTGLTDLLRAFSSMPQIAQGAEAPPTLPAIPTARPAWWPTNQPWPPTFTPPAGEQPPPEPGILPKPEPSGTPFVPPPVGTTLEGGPPPVTGGGLPDRAVAVRRPPAPTTARRPPWSPPRRRIPPTPTEPEGT